MRHIAKHLFDPVAQPLPKPSKWKGRGREGVNFNWIHVWSKESKGW
jgi:hypothetical protein